MSERLGGMRKCQQCISHSRTVWEEGWRMVAVLITDCATVASFLDTLRDIARTPDLMQRLYLLLLLLLQ